MEFLLWGVKGSIEEISEEVVDIIQVRDGGCLDLGCNSGSQEMWLDVDFLVYWLWGVR